MPLKLAQYTLISAFLLVITAPLFLFNNETEFSSREKRTLATPPEWPVNLDQLNDFPAKFTAHFDDHYGLRSELIERNQHLKKKYFDKSPAWLVISGEQGWLFMDKKDSLKDHIGQVQLSRDTLAQWQQQLLDKQRWLKNAGLKYLIAPIPNKMTLYSDYLPKRIRKYSGITMLDQFLTYLTGQAKFTSYINLEPVLSRYQHAHPEEALYFKTDTHWTSLGAFVAYQHIMQKLRTQLPGLEPELELHEMQRKAELKKGDLANIINKENQQEEAGHILTPAKQCASDIYTPVYTHLFKELPKPAKESPAVFNGCAEKNFTAVIVYDSFGEAIRPFFSESFKRVIFISNYEFSDMELLLNKQQPDVYLDLRVERNLRTFFKSDPMLRLGG